MDSKIMGTDAELDKSAKFQLKLSFYITDSSRFTSLNTITMEKLGFVIFRKNLAKL